MRCTPLNVANRVLVMAEGRIVEEGRSAELMRNPQSARAKRFLSAVKER